VVDASVLFIFDVSITRQRRPAAPFKNPGAAALSDSGPGVSGESALFIQL
jgi:hypothetical protein